VTAGAPFSTGFFQLELNGPDDCTATTCSNDPPAVIVGGYRLLFPQISLTEVCNPERLSSRFVVGGAEPVQISRMSFSARAQSTSSPQGQQFTGTVSVFTSGFVGSTNTVDGRGPLELVAQASFSETAGSATTFRNYTVDIPATLAAGGEYWVVFDRTGGASFATGQSGLFDTLPGPIAPQTQLLQFTASGPWMNCSSQGFLPYVLSFDPPPEACVDDTWTGVCVARP
jgi:hypothetical protein